MRPRAVITGAARRVGRAIALELAPVFDLALHCHRSADEAEQVAVACRQRGAQVRVFAADLGEALGCQTLADEVLEEWSKIHLLVNNASRFEPVPFSQLDAERWDAMHAVNLRAPFLLSRLFLDALAREGGNALGAPEGQHGVVIHLCDIGAQRPISGYAHYSTSKAGLVMLVKAMAVELSPAVRTIGISPGQVAWPPAYPEEKRSRLRRRIPLSRAGDPEDVARIVRFIACEAHYVNGVIWPVDGGLSARY